MAIPDFIREPVTRIEGGMSAVIQSTDFQDLTSIGNGTGDLVNEELLEMKGFAGILAVFEDVAAACPCGIPCLRSNSFVAATNVSGVSKMQVAAHAWPPAEGLLP